MISLINKLWEFGLIPVVSSLLNSQFALKIGTATSSPQIIEFTSPSTGQFQYGISTIVQITTNPTIVTVVNLTAARSINNVTQKTSGGPAAYITIIGLQQ